MAQKIVRKGKREWYNVVAPNVFKNKEVGEILAYTPKELVGRCVELAYSAVTDNPRDRNKFFSVRITGVADKNAQTEPVKITYSTGFVQRVIKRNKTNELVVVNYPLKDGKRVTAKLYILATNDTTKGVRTSLIKKVESLLEKKFGKTASEQLFEPTYLENLSKELRTGLKTIYPVNSITFWKILVGA